MAHKVRYLYIENDPRPHVARCRCGWTSVHSVNRQAVEDDILKHQENVERLRAALGGQPSLKSTRDYYLMMAENPEQSADQRDLWKRLAEEITHRLNDTASDADTQAALF